jgi:dTMP kinase
MSLRSVALVGIDGSGKSTQTELLEQRLRTEGSSVVRIHPYGWKLLPLNARGPSLDGSSADGPSSSRLGRQLIALAELVDLGVYLWLATARVWLSRVLRRRRTVLLSDRSAAATLVKHRRRGTFGPGIVDRWYRLVPTPRRTVWLRVDPAEAASRDGDFGIDYYEEHHARYHAASEEFGWTVVDASGRSVDEVHAELTRVLGLGPVRS